MSDTQANDNRVWFVTGASKGIGLSLVKRLVKNGFRVAATSRSTEQLIKNLGELYNTDQVLALSVDLANEESVKQAVSDTLGKFSTIDVVVNNAGYGFFSPIEAISDKEARDLFDINFFGPLNIMRNTLPHLRTNKSSEYGPRIYNISSVGGFFGNFPGVGLYCASKFALDGLTQSANAELAEFGIKVTSVLPGYFRTEFLQSTSVSVSKNFIPEYETANKVTDLHINQVNNNQSGDPDKLADLLINISREKNPPLTLPVGPDAYEYFGKRIEAIQKDLEAFKDQTTKTNL
ncbi:hypothetical protein CYY_007119 [Polysphondylium violaceum]|uniref:Uncharacterized protein n=1 Tax=Polysphondylium violaceum TaxID=133409 RepID=A0A8J4V2I5_9MYCE|nr:hypothetical protein CYY_007119 [Polysphondylium violaceum]